MLRVLVLNEVDTEEEDYVRELLHNSADFVVIGISISRSLAFSSWGKFDAMAVPYVPSPGSPFFWFVKSALEAGIKTICLNLDQLRLGFEYEYKGEVIRHLGRLGLAHCVYAKSFAGFLNDITSDVGAINIFPVPPPKRGEIVGVGLVSGRHLAILDFRWLTADDNYLTYKARGGADLARVLAFKEFSRKYALEFFRQLRKFLFDNPDKSVHVHLDIAVSLDEFFKTLGIESHWVGRVFFTTCADFRLQPTLTDYVVTNCHSTSLLLKRRGVRVACLAPIECPGWLKPDYATLGIGLSYILDLKHWGSAPALESVDEAFLNPRVEEVAIFFLGNEERDGSAKPKFFCRALWRLAYWRVRHIPYNLKNILKQRVGSVTKCFRRCVVSTGSRLGGQSQW
jgi:hypothetical protein